MWWKKRDASLSAGMLKFLQALISLLSARFLAPSPPPHRPRTCLRPTPVKQPFVPRTAQILHLPLLAAMPPPSLSPNRSTTLSPNTPTLTSPPTSSPMGLVLSIPREDLQSPTLLMNLQRSKPCEPSTVTSSAISKKPLETGAMRTFCLCFPSPMETLTVWLRAFWKVSSIFFWTATCTPQYSNFDGRSRSLAAQWVR